MKRLVGRVDVCGIPFVVFLVDDVGAPGLKGHDGFCLSRRGEIYVRGDDGISQAYKREVLRHELFHAVWYHAGCEDVCSGSVPKAVEEAMILSIVPHLSRAWDQAGKLKL